MYLPLFVGVLRWSLFLYALLYDLSSVAIILMRTSELVVMLLLSLGLHFMIVVFPDRTYLLTF